MPEFDSSRAAWRKASRSNSEGGACVEAAAVAGVVGLRDSKDPDGPVLAFERGSWHAFLNDVKTARGRWARH